MTEEILEQRAQMERAAGTDEGQTLCDQLAATVRRSGGEPAPTDVIGQGGKLVEWPRPSELPDDGGTEAQVLLPAAQRAGARCPSIESVGDSESPRPAYDLIDDGTTQSSFERDRVGAPGADRERLFDPPASAEADTDLEAICTFADWHGRPEIYALRASDVTRTHRRTRTARSSPEATRRSTVRIETERRVATSLMSIIAPSIRAFNGAKDLWRALLNSGSPEQPA